MINFLERLDRWTAIGVLIGAVALIVIGNYYWKSPVGSSKRGGLVVINVLDKELYDDCHIKGSINVPFTQLTQYVQNLDPETAEIVLYCSNYMCSTSGHACKQLKKMGFKHVWAYEGGTAEWYQKGLPVEGPCKSSYLTQKMTPPHYEDEQAAAIITAEELAEKMAIKA